MKKTNINEMNMVVCHLCAHIGLTCLGETPQDGDMNGMTVEERAG